MSELTIAFRRHLVGFDLDVDLALPMQGVTGLFGHSGSGKTTILRAMAGLERCAGSMTFGDQLWQDDARGVFLKPEQRAIAYVFQEASLFPHLSVRANIEYGYRRLESAKRRISLHETVAWLGLEKLLGRSVQKLSGGERQRVAIARALLASPDLLLMDEPLSALDTASKREIMPCLEYLHHHLEIPVIYVSHSADEVAQMADHVVLLEAGRVVGEGPMVEMLSRADRQLLPGEEPGAVIVARVRSHDDLHALTVLDLPDHTGLLSPRLDAESGDEVRIRIPAREVSIVLEPPSGSSILNILPAEIISAAEGEPGRMLVHLAIGSGERRTQLLSRISRYSWDRLALHDGMRVQAQIKSMGLARS